MKRTRQFPALTGLAVCALLGGCTVGPKYQRATAPVPAKWDVSEPWREGAPKDDLAKGEWWSIFRDDELGALEKQALDANQTIKVSAAHLEQAGPPLEFRLPRSSPFFRLLPVSSGSGFPETGQPTATSL